ncbi:MAG: M28 family peptidase [Bacteroidales bacterium]|nr:M28 family peptidase [Bacteroidales bacterium]
MKKILPLLLLLPLLIGVADASAQSRKERLTEYVNYLASEELQGRGAATAGDIKAREYIAARYKECGLQPLSGGDFLVPFETKGTSYCNVVGVIEGGALKDEFIVLGAHYDHLGVKKGEIYPGADDNASGSAALIEIARELVAQKDQLQRSVIIAAFDAEELGLFGSTSLAGFLDELVGIKNVKLMVSVDMVGRYAGHGSLVLEGVATIRDGRVLASETAKRHSIKVRPKNFETSVLTATDTDAFARKGVPTLAVSTGIHPQYHKPTDTPDLIDYDGLDKVTGYLSDFAAQAAIDPDWKASGKVARKHNSKQPAVEFGVLGGFAGSSISFPKADISAKGLVDYSAGLVGRANFGAFGLQLEALYERSNSRFPSLDTPLGTSQDYMQQGITVPAYLLIRSNDSRDAAFVGFGGYYSYVFSHSFSKADPGWTVNPHQGGLAAVAGIKVANLLLQWSFRTQLGSLFASGAPVAGSEAVPEPSAPAPVTAAPEARLGVASYITVGWFF